MDQNFLDSNMSRRVINVYVPPISSFPELSLLGGYGLKDRIELPKTSTKRRSGRGMENVMEEHEESHFLYVIDSKGRLLEHLRYFGDDYRSVLKETFAADQDIEVTPKKVAEPMSPMDLVSDLSSTRPTTIKIERPDTQRPFTQTL